MYLQNLKQCLHCYIHSYEVFQNDSMFRNWPCNRRVAGSNPRRGDGLGCPWARHPIHWQSAAHCSCTWLVCVYYQSEKDAIKSVVNFAITNWGVCMYFGFSLFFFFSLIKTNKHDCFSPGRNISKVKTFEESQGPNLSAHLHIFILKTP